jgi:hypothetical protein
VNGYVGSNAGTDDSRAIADCRFGDEPMMLRGIPAGGGGMVF